MNDARNLMVICQACHDAIHNETLVVGPVQQTSDGPQRVIQQVEKSAKKSKWSEEELETVKTTLKKYSSLSLKAVKAHLSSKHSIEMSESMLGKVRKDL